LHFALAPRGNLGLPFPVNRCTHERPLVTV
jgi:hypothetical protein